MKRRECSALLLGSAIAGALIPIGSALRAATGAARATPDADRGVRLYSSLVDWWQNGCRGVRPSVTMPLAQTEQAFLEDLQRRAFRYFWEQGDPQTGLVLDRARADGLRVTGPSHNVASIAATGFGLTAICAAAERGWITPAAASSRVRLTLDFLANRATNVHGWFYHFLNSATGERAWKCEISSIDTALLLAGVLTARQKFHRDSAIVDRATTIYRRIDFGWMRNGNPTLLSMGWRPETGFLKATWNMYAEETMLYLLGIGSPTYPLPVESWHAWKRTWTDYGGYRFLNSAPLFTHQYSQAYVDYRDRFESTPPYINLFINSIAATLANRAFCMSLAKRFPDYTGDIWGVTASDSAHGYTAWGRVPVADHIDGTVVPCAAGGSLMFTPQVCLQALRSMKARFGDRGIDGKSVWGRYGFVDAFNPLSGWVDADVLGIDQGITLVSAENARSGAVWRWFMANPEPVKALEMVGLRLGFHPT